MAVAYDTDVAWTSAAATSTSQALTLGASATVLYIGQIADASSFTNPNPTSIQYNSVAVSTTPIIQFETNRAIRIWRLISPDTGSSYNIDISWTGSYTGKWFAFSVSGTDTSSPDGSSSYQNDNGASVTSLSTTVTSAVDDMVVSLVNANGPPGNLTTTGSDGTEQLEADLSSVALQIQSAAGASSVTMATTWVGAQGAAMVAFNINQPAAASGGGLQLVGGAGLVGSNG